MTSSSYAPSLSSPAYGPAVSFCLRSLAATEAACLSAQAPGRAGDQTRLALATLDGLCEVLEWNNQGQAADELACIWLSYLRWMAGAGYQLDDSAPFSLARPLNGQTFMARPAQGLPGIQEALADGQMDLPGKSSRPLAQDPELLPALLPLAFLPLEQDETVASLARQTAALTQGRPEAGKAAVSYCLGLRYLLGAQLAGVTAQQRPLAQVAKALELDLSSSLSQAAQEQAPQTVGGLLALAWSLLLEAEEGLLTGSLDPSRALEGLLARADSQQAGPVLPLLLVSLAAAAWGPGQLADYPLPQLDQETGQALELVLGNYLAQLT